MSNTITIEASDLVDFTFKIQQAILDGYRLSDQGDFAPMNIGWVYVTTMEKAKLGPIDELSLVLDVDTGQAIAEITKIAQEAGQYEMTSEQQDAGANIVAGAITVEPNIIPPKQPRQTRGRK